jgi:hypothetical protein
VTPQLLSAQELFVYAGSRKGKARAVTFLGARELFGTGEQKTSNVACDPYHSWLALEPEKHWMQRYAVNTILLLIRLLFPPCGYERTRAAAPLLFVNGN